MIPDIHIDSIQNKGERDFYRIASLLPDDYTVLYSYKYQIGEYENNLVREADFIIVHPLRGYIVVEVKQGNISYHNGRWYEIKDGNYQPLHKDPVEQARTAMFEILNSYRKKSGGNDYPLGIRYAVCFPEATKFSGVLPQDLNKESIWTLNELGNLEKTIEKLFDKQNKRNAYEANKILINKVLSPVFKIYSTLEDQIALFHQQSEIILSEEQERILDETEEDHRKVFFGAAGTGKTYIAMEKAKRLANEQKKVFLTCYNKNLAKLFNNYIDHENIQALNFLDYIEKDLTEKGIYMEKPKKEEDLSSYYDEILPSTAFDYYSSLTEAEKFDAIIVDEGQDFKEEWIITLLSMVKENGHFYIFADDKQNIFRTNIEALRRFDISKHRLTVNFRNTQKINEWFASFINEKRLRSKLSGGLPVQTIKWKNQDEEKQILEKEISRLVSQGLSPNRITILSPYTKKKSCLGSISRIKEWPIVDLKKENGSGIKFSTIRSFKGLEADIVFLIDVHNNDLMCSPEEIYVGASRARYMLYVLHHENWKNKLSI
ncbi:AAA domain-containing protein [Vulcanibacillus modesticaldus]|nr:AAA domain-containing protein [Vulcanibacillus modesticaldus]